MDQEKNSSAANHGNQTFLKTLIHFQGTEQFLINKEFQQSIRKDINYLVVKRNIKNMGGKLTLIIEKQKVLA